ncbi:unnamed protein product, partial [marine sediment metagenome]
PESQAEFWRFFKEIYKFKLALELNTFKLSL